MAESTPATSADGTPAKATRRRVINRPQGTFAYFLDSLISYSFTRLDPTVSTFTSYKESLATALGIKPRQLSRLLSGQVLPEIRLLKKLADLFPNQIQTEGWIPRLKWEGIAEELKFLPQKSVITVFAGHFSAHDIDQFQAVVLKDFGSMIIDREFKIAYVFAPLSERLIKDELLPIQIAERLRLKILSRWLDINPNAKRDPSIERRITQRFIVFQTKGCDESAHFWSRLPRYLIATNLLADTRSEFSEHQFSVAFDSGSVPYPSARTNPANHVPSPISSGGWIYWDVGYEAEFREMFQQLVGAQLVKNAEEKRTNFPRPG
jgi:transcriptional regulator with XRE-family HTH domain